MGGKVRKFKSIYGHTENEALANAAAETGWQLVLVKRLIGGMWVATVFKYVSMREAMACSS